MIKRTIELTILAAAMLVGLPATARAQLNPALIGEGALLWGNNCGRCHNIRPTTERTDAQWAIIVKHMRARANLTAHQAEAVLTYLQATNTAEPVATTADSRSRPSAGGSHEPGSDVAQASETPGRTSRGSPRLPNDPEIGR